MTKKRTQKKRAPVTQAVAKRPTETLTGPALGLVVYGFTTQVGLSHVVAGVLAVVAAFGPLVVSRTVDALRGS